MIKRKFYIIIFLFILLAGCEKVIDVDLNKANPEIVIEGNLSFSPAESKVKVSKSGGYFGNSSTQMVSNANVIIENNMSERFLLKENNAGEYASSDVFPQEGNTYKLIVEYEEEVYEATSKMNSVVAIDSLSYFYDEGFAFINAGYNVKVHFVDIVNEANYYRLKVFKNDTLKNEMDDFIVFDDRLIDGESIEIILSGKTFEVGDKATIQLISLDEGAYTYFNTFQELITTNPGSAAPANPTSNLSNGALGYFSAWSSDLKSIIIKEIE